MAPPTRSTPIKTVLFLGASGGTGFATLQRSLREGYICVALCRTPSRLTSKFPDPRNISPNLIIHRGDAKDLTAISKCLVHPHNSTKFVDVICYTIGVTPELNLSMFEAMKQAGLVCQQTMPIVLDALVDLREKGITGRPRIVAMSTTGLSKLQRDFPLLGYPIYEWMLTTPHKDKLAMEEMLFKSGEQGTIVRASLLTSGPESGRPIRLGVEDSQAGILESSAVGWSISRNDVGKWIFENILKDGRPDLIGKVASITI